jgi:hypothetical protein
VPRWRSVGDKKVQVAPEMVNKLYKSKVMLRLLHVMALPTRVYHHPFTATTNGAWSVFIRGCGNWGDLRVPPEDRLDHDGRT